MQINEPLHSSTLKAQCVVPVFCVWWPPGDLKGPVAIVCSWLSLELDWNLALW